MKPCSGLRSGAWSGRHRGNPTVIRTKNIKDSHHQVFLVFQLQRNIFKEKNSSSTPSPSLSPAAWLNRPWLSNSQVNKKYSLKSNFDVSFSSILAGLVRGQYCVGTWHKLLVTSSPLPILVHSWFRYKTNKPKLFCSHPDESEFSQRPPSLKMAGLRLDKVITNKEQKLGLASANFLGQKCCYL